MKTFAEYSALLDEAAANGQVNVVKSYLEIMANMPAPFAIYEAPATAAEYPSFKNLVFLVQEELNAPSADGKAMLRKWLERYDTAQASSTWTGTYPTDNRYVGVKK